VACSKVNYIYIYIYSVCVCVCYTSFYTSLHATHQHGGIYALCCDEIKLFTFCIFSDCNCRSSIGPCTVFSSKCFSACRQELIRMRTLKSFMFNYNLPTELRVSLRNASYVKMSREEKTTREFATANLENCSFCALFLVPLWNVKCNINTGR
jgi:hypothetical protein